MTVGPDVEADRLQITMDGSPLVPGADPVPVEAGKHIIMAAANGFIPRTIEVSVGTEPQRRSVQVDRLIPVLVIRPSSLASPALLPTTTATISKTAPPEPAPRHAKIWLWAAVGIAVAAGVSAALLLANSRVRYPSSDVTGNYP